MKIVLLSFFVAFSLTAVIFILNVLFAKEACTAKIKPVFFSEPAFLRKMNESMITSLSLVVIEERSKLSYRICNILCLTIS